MKMNKKMFNKMSLFTIFFVLCSLVLVISSEAAFKDSGWGTRPSGMGGAFTGISNDATAPLWNVAGIAQLRRCEANFMYAKLFTGLTLYAGEDTTSLGLNYFSFVCPTKSIGVFGVSWASFVSTELYKESTFAFSYAKKINDFVPAMGPEICLGVNLKYLNHGYTLDDRTIDDPVFEEGSSKGAFTADLGTLIKPQEGSPLSIGLALKNVTQPDVGLDKTANKLDDKVPLDVRFGTAYQFKNLMIFNEVTPALDINYRNKDINYYVGLETKFSPIFALRMGYNPQEASLGVGLNPFVGDTFGIKFDYALLWPLEVEGTSGSHRVSLGIYF